MQIVLKPGKDVYSESEAAVVLGISVGRLRLILDEFVFNDGATRPPRVTFRASELIVLSFWNRSMPNPKIVRMPKR